MSHQKYGNYISPWKKTENFKAPAHGSDAEIVLLLISLFHVVTSTLKMELTHGTDWGIVIVKISRESCRKWWRWSGITRNIKLYALLSFHAQIPSNSVQRRI